MRNARGRGVTGRAMQLRRLRKGEPRLPKEDLDVSDFARLEAIARRAMAANKKRLSG